MIGIERRARAVGDVFQRPPCGGQRQFRPTLAGKFALGDIHRIQQFFPMLKPLSCLAQQGFFARLRIDLLQLADGVAQIGFLGPRRLGVRR